MTTTTKKKTAPKPYDPFVMGSQNKIRVDFDHMEVEIEFNHEDKSTYYVKLDYIVAELLASKLNEAAKKAKDARYGN